MENDFRYYAYGAVGFLCAWAAKHALDRLFLPRVIDWWASLSKRRAIRRGEKIISQFIRDLMVIRDQRLTTLQSYYFIANFLGAVSSMTAFVFLTMMVGWFDDNRWLIISMGFCCSVLLMLMAVGHAEAVSRLETMALDMTFATRHAAGRVEALFLAGGMDAKAVNRRVREFEAVAGGPFTPPLPDDSKCESAPGSPD